MNNSYCIIDKEKRNIGKLARIVRDSKYIKYHLPDEDNFDKSFCLDYIFSFFKELDIDLYNIVKKMYNNKKVSFPNNITYDNCHCVIDVDPNSNKIRNYKINMPNLNNSMGIISGVHEIIHGIFCESRVHNSEFQYGKSIFDEVLSNFFQLLIQDKLIKEYGYTNSVANGKLSTYQFSKIVANIYLDNMKIISKLYISHGFNSKSTIDNSKGKDLLFGELRNYITPIENSAFDAMQLPIGITISRMIKKQYEQNKNEVLSVIKDFLFAENPLYIKNHSLYIDVLMSNFNINLANPFFIDEYSNAISEYNQSVKSL